MKIFAFKLTMPGVGSWNGSWSGDKDLYIKFKKLTNAQIKSSPIEEGSYHYDFGDGWRANVSVFVVDSKERTKLERRSKGFSGYDWMIDSIIQRGKIVCKEDEEFEAL